MRKLLTDEEFNLAMNNRSFRIALIKESFELFLQFYLYENFTLPLAPFHYDIIDVLQSDQKYIGIIGFRGSAKSTFMEYYALWSMITGRNEHIVYFKATDPEARESLRNIKNILETNKLLQQDLGLDIKETKQRYFEKWSESQIVIGNCTLVAKSKGQKVRGKKFKNARIDLIIGDDLEDVKSAAKEEERKKTRKWFLQEVLPATKQGVLADNVKVVLIGNLVHNDCLLMYLKKSKIVDVLEFAIYTPEGEIAWKGMYPDEAAIEAEKEKVYIAGEGDGHIIWAREYLLKVIPEGDAVITEDDIVFYDNERLTSQIDSIRIRPKDSLTAIDLAISEKKSADYTAGVSLILSKENGEEIIYVKPNPYHKRVDLHNLLIAMQAIHKSMPLGHRFVMEDVAYQKAAIKEAKRVGLPVEGIRPIGDKRARFSTAAIYIKQGKVRFPKKGAEELLNEMLYFGIEEHDDLLDALVYAILAIMDRRRVIAGTGRPDTI